MLEARAELESRNSYNQTPLSRAARFGHEGIIKLLLEAGADLESKDNGGRTPLSAATEVSLWFDTDAYYWVDKTFFLRYSYRSLVRSRYR